MSALPPGLAPVPPRWDFAVSDAALHELGRMQVLCNQAVRSLRVDAQRAAREWRGTARDDFDVRSARLLGDLAELERDLAVRQRLVQAQVEVVRRAIPLTCPGPHLPPTDWFDTSYAICPR